MTAPEILVCMSHLMEQGCTFSMEHARYKVIFDHNPDVSVKSPFLEDVVKKANTIMASRRSNQLKRGQPPAPTSE